VRLARATLAACLVLAAGGCASSETSGDRINPEKPLWYHQPIGAMHIRFLRELTATSGGGSVFPAEPYERGRAEIDAVHGRVFVGTSDHGLYALRAADGSTIWRFETMGPVQSEPLYDPELDVVYFGSHDGALYAVHASDGQLIWRYQSGAEVARKAVVSGETLVFANGADNLFAVDRRSGKALWHVHRSPALGMEVSGYSGPAVDEGVVFFAFSDGHVGAYDVRDGSERWLPVDLSAEAEQAQAGEALRYLDVDTTPIPDNLGPLGRVVFVASYAGGVYALDEERGAPLWKNEKAIGVTDMTLWREAAHPSRPGSPDYVPGAPEVPKREILVVASGASGLWGLDPTNGHMLWRMPIPEGGVTAPVAVSGALLVGTTQYGAFLLSPLNGRPIDGFDLGTGFSQTPAGYGARAFMMSNAGTLLGIEIDPPRGESAER
jgi:outer membrane protein assembly factor BamB